MLYFSSLLQTNSKYQPVADRLFAALDSSHQDYQCINNAKDIWLRDFMPIKTKSDKYVSFRYEPSYLKGYEYLQTEYRRDVSMELNPSNIIYSDINLDGGNVVFSPSKERVVISERIFSENPQYTKDELIQKLSKILEAEVIMIPALCQNYDMTGHTDGMVRFVDEHTAIVNETSYKKGLEQKIKLILKNKGIKAVDFPYFDSLQESAKGSYLNFLETNTHLFLPIFNHETDERALQKAKEIFSKTLMPININEIAEDGGVLNCISWED